jgi:hypothetical protein
MHYGSLFLSQVYSLSLSLSLCPHSHNSSLQKHTLLFFVCGISLSIYNKSIFWIWGAQNGGHLLRSNAMKSTNVSEEHTFHIFKAPQKWTSTRLYGTISQQTAFLDSMNILSLI